MINAAGVWPTPVQQDLLAAALEGCPAAFDRWIARVDPEHLDAASHRLLPLLYRTLQQSSAQHPFLARCRGFYRYTWYRNQTWLYRTEPLLQELADHGIPALLLKGTALAARYYRDMGSRPMDDVDLAVPRHQARAALHLLRQRGFRCANLEVPENPEDAYFSSCHSCDLIDDDRYRLDLHWHPLIYATRPEVAAAFWQHAEPVRIKDLSALAPSATDMLIHVLVHGLQYNPVPPIRWVADACMILRVGGIDWRRFVAQCIDWHVTLPVADGLEFLQREFATQVPAAIVAELRATRIGLLERLGYAAQLRPYEDRGFLDVVAYRYSAYTRSEIAAQGRGLLQYLRGTFSTGSLWSVIRRLVSIIRR